jgi:hypothetical protein
LLADGTLNFLGDRTNYKAKDISGKITNLLIHINHLFNRICYQLANKTTNFLCVIQLFIYIIYDFVSFVASLLDSNRWRHCQRPKMCVLKRVTFRPLLSM